MRLAALIATFSLLAALDPAAQAPAGERTPPLKSFDVSLIDRSVDPCTNFYEFACGTWRKANPVPGDKARWGRFDQLRELNLWTLKDILDDASQPREGAHGAPDAGGRLLRLVHRPGRHRGGGAEADRRAFVAQSTRCRRRTTSCASRVSLRRDGLSTFFTFGVGADLQDSDRDTDERGSGRHVAAGSRLLPEGRCEER